MFKKIFTYFIDMSYITKYHIQMGIYFSIMVLSVLFFIGFCAYSHYTFKKELQNYARKNTQVIQNQCETIGSTTRCVTSVRFIRKAEGSNAQK